MPSKGGFGHKLSAWLKFLGITGRKKNFILLILAK
jgi:hypothetical protein